MLSVYIRTNPFKSIPQYCNIGTKSFTSGTSDTRKLIKAAFEVLDNIFRSGYEYKKSGVMLNNIYDRRESQLSLFDPSDTIQDEKLMSIIDIINDKEGENSLKWAACGTQNSWKMARNYKSPCYTTRWSDILKVRYNKCAS